MKHPQSSFSTTVRIGVFSLATLLATAIAWSADSGAGSPSAGEDGRRGIYKRFDIMSNGMVVGDAWVDINSHFPDMGWDIYLLPNWDCRSDARKTNDGEEEIWTSTEGCGRIIHNLVNDEWMLLIDDSSFTLVVKQTEATGEPRATGDSDPTGDSDQTTQTGTHPDGTLTTWTITDSSEPALIGTTASLTWNSQAFTYEVRCETGTYGGYLSDQWWDYSWMPEWNLVAEGFRAYSLWSNFPMGYDRYLRLRVGNTYLESTEMHTN